LKKLIFYSLTTFILLSILNFIQAYINLDSYENTNYLEKEEQIKIIVNDTHRLSNALFDNIINTENVIDIFKKASTSNKEEKVKIRKELYDLLINNYNNFTNYGIQQLHFHLPNNLSFLRFHQPLKFGDDLTNIRASVKFVNENKIATIGFEEGRIFNGYRFVYPLFDENKKHIGSVEISSSLLNFKKLFEKNNKTHIDYILKKDVVENKVFKEQVKNYEKYLLSDNFLIQKNMVDYDINCKHKEEKDIIFEKLSKDKEFLKKINSMEKIHNIYFHNLNVYSINFTPLLNDFTNKKVGYMIMFSESNYFKYILDSYIINILIITLLSILIGYVILKKEQDKELTEKLAIYDQLTNIYNRYYFRKEMEKEFTNMQKQTNELSLIMFDIDHFKLINDNYGHNIGDESLIFLSNLVKNNIRLNDVFCRWGGEEFMILSNKSLDKTVIMAEYLRKTIDNESKENDKIPHFTCSFGVVSLNKFNNTKEALQRVDELLYKSKKDGRNIVSN
jgi:diguanylate cyclase (GGDEF)-like protein